VFATHMLRFTLLLNLEGGFLAKDVRDFDFVLLSAPFRVGHRDTIHSRFSLLPSSMMLFAMERRKNKKM
jgi:hypothetical protein